MFEYDYRYINTILNFADFINFGRIALFFVLKERIIMPSLYEIPIEKLHGIGEKRAKLFKKLNIKSVGDLVCYYPRTYENWSNIINISDLYNLSDNQAISIKACVVTPVRNDILSGGRIISKLNVSDESGTIEIVFFNNKYITTMLKYGETYYFYGKVSKNRFSYQMISPEFTPVAKAVAINPVYNLTAGLTNRIVISAVKKALALLPNKIKETLPEFVLSKYKLCSLDFAIRNIHFPSDMDVMETARHRLAFEELLSLHLGMHILKNSVKEKTPVSMPVDYTSEFISTLPYTLTLAQKRAVVDCVNDMKNKKSPMNRLVQGDVGSGKTAVCAAVCYNCVKNGYQAAFMAPTEILAQQHFETFSKMFCKFNVKIELLTGSMTPKEKRLSRERISSGESDIIIGTHALISESTVFKNLGFAITDEQHRFGVEQRSKLQSKGRLPHVLVLSATPIPRTLGLIIYGDLDITCIDEMPPNRQEVKTVCIDSSKRDSAFKFIKQQLDMGRQCYIVCPLVEEGELDLKSANDYAAELMLGILKDYPIGILHGKMKPADKDEVMHKFSTGKISVLVSTTVIEVGVDVKNATVIMIENADRFGLSQLHQLRGRVGRGDYKSYCILLSDNKSDQTVRRLSVMCRTTNGFEIADEDLKMRGVGDFFGNRQHGLPNLTIANLSDMDTVYESRSAASDILKFSPDLTDNSLSMLKSQTMRLFSDGLSAMN